MAFSTNILPKASSYYALSNATINNYTLSLSAGGFAEIQVTNQMLPKLTGKMLIVVHPSVFSSSYTNDAIQVAVSILTTSGKHIEYLIPVCYDKSGVFNTEITLPEETFSTFTYRISSSVPVMVYNWELCAEEAVDVTTVIDGVEQSLPKLLYDFNTYAYAVDQKEVTVGLISCYLLDATDLQGHFNLSFFATERCNVHVRIKDNTVTELFSPQVYTVEKGYASIDIPHAYLHKLATEHDFSVTIQCTNGQLSIPVRGLLYTIDGGYLATRLLDAGVDIEDISVRQLPTDSGPSEVWAIGYESLRLILKKREYSLLQRVNWEVVKDFGEGACAAVEFHGNWLNRNNADKYTIETESTPFVFIVGLDGVLRCYRGEDFTTVDVIDTEVTAIAACQGFGSMYDIEQRQGLIVTYIKKGNVYYRQWLYDTTNSRFMWKAAYEVYTNGDATFVSIHRLPDYRVGVCVGHPAGTKWFITDRTYVSQSVKPETIRSYVDDFVMCSVFDRSKAPSTVVWPGTTNEFEVDFYYNNFIMSFDGPLVLLNNVTYDDLRESITVYINGRELEEGVAAIFVEGNSIGVRLVEDVKGSQTVRIKLNCDYLFMRAYNNCYATIQQDFSWTLLMPTTYADHSDSIGVSVEAEVNALVTPIITTDLPATETAEVEVDPTLNISVREIITHSLACEDSVSVSVGCDVTVKVMQVGQTPI